MFTIDSAKLILGIIESSARFVHYERPVEETTSQSTDGGRTRLASQDPLVAASLCVG